MSNDKLDNAYKYSTEKVNAILDAVRNGMNIKNACQENGITFQTWCNWKDDNNFLFDLYVKAWQDKAEGLESEIDRIMIMLEKKEVDPSTANVLIQTLKWKIAKMYPKMFGDKIDITSDTKPLASKPIDLSNATSEQLKLLGELIGITDKN